MAITAVRTSLCLLAAMVLLGWAGAAPFPDPDPAPVPDPSPIWRLFGGFGGYNGGYYNRGGYSRGSRAYNGPPPEGPNEYKSICRVNNPDNFAFGPGHIPAGPVCPW